MTDDGSDFARNLKWLCARESSVSEVCRRIGINRQQFARYLNGSVRPSSHNFWQICSYFDVEPELLSLPFEDFRKAVAGEAFGDRHTNETLGAVFPGNRRELRRFSGLYHTHFRSPSQPGRIIRSLLHVFEQDGFFHSRTLEKLPHKETGLDGITRYSGLIAMHGDTLFLIERDRASGRNLSESIMTPMHRGAVGWLSGILLAAAWSNGRPYATACLWKRLNPSFDQKRAIALCGAFPLERQNFEKTVIDFFSSSESEMTISSPG